MNVLIMVTSMYAGVHRPVCYNYNNQASIGADQTHGRCNVGEVCTCK